MFFMSFENSAGCIDSNTRGGLFGSLSSPEALSGRLYETAEESLIHPGAALLLSDIAGNGVEEYEAEILKVFGGGKPAGRGMLIRVTDKRLLELTGGIVQGMSGSPVIQDGRLCGAVTHVMINDPERGYGIFIENMLKAAQG